MVIWSFYKLQPFYYMTAYFFREQIQFELSLSLIYRLIKGMKSLIFFILKVGGVFNDLQSDISVFSFENLRIWEYN